MSEREPITAELRRVMNHTTMAGVPLVEIGEYEFGHRCDAIDAVHAGLERENAELRQRVAELDKRDDSMHDGGSITDELRRFIEDPLLGYAPQDQHIEILTEIADRIDAEHESACAEAYGNGVMSAPIALDESQWVKLPVDADGEPIHIGDVMESKGSDSLFGEASFEVRSMRCDECGWEVYDRFGDRYAPSLLCHHHAPTVEDVLTKFGIDWEYEDNCEDRAALLAEYAAKLRLAEGEDA